MRTTKIELSNNVSSYIIQHASKEGIENLDIWIRWVGSLTSSLESSC